MLKFNTKFLLLLMLPLLAISLNNPIVAQLSETARWATTLQLKYRSHLNITYLRANNVPLKVDIYTPKKSEKPVPTLMYFHGGGWIRGAKDVTTLQILPYIEQGWSVVTVQYRLRPTSPAPAAVEDCLCALRWVIRNAEKYNFDVNKIVLSGDSAGGHLALTTGMLPESVGLDRQCPGKEELKVAAIVNWYGITDVADLLEGQNERSYAVEWVGSRTDRLQLAQRVSPINYVREDLPPIITIHGDADTIVPYSHGVQLHQALEQVEVPNELVTISGGGHGNFTENEMIYIYDKIHTFLSNQINN